MMNYDEMFFHYETLKYSDILDTVIPNTLMYSITIEPLLKVVTWIDLNKGLSMQQI